MAAQLNRLNIPAETASAAYRNRAVTPSFANVRLGWGAEWGRPVGLELPVMKTLRKWLVRPAATGTRPSPTPLDIATAHFIGGAFPRRLSDADWIHCQRCMELA